MFTIEYGFLENAHNLAKKINPDLNYEDWFPTDPIGILAGIKIPVPTLNAFELAIKVNNSAIAKHNEPYRNQEWMDEILKVLREKHSN